MNVGPRSIDYATEASAHFAIANYTSCGNGKALMLYSIECE